MGILALNIGLKHASEVIDIPVSIVQWDIFADGGFSCDSNRDVSIEVRYEPPP